MRKIRHDCVVYEAHLKERLLEHGVSETKIPKRDRFGAVYAGNLPDPEANELMDKLLIVHDLLTKLEDHKKSSAEKIRLCQGTLDQQNKGKLEKRRGLRKSHDFVNLPEWEKGWINFKHKITQAVNSFYDYMASTKLLHWLRVGQVTGKILVEDIDKEIKKFDEEAKHLRPK